MSEAEPGGDGREDGGDEGGERHENAAGRPAGLTYGRWAAAVREGRLLGQACGGCGHVSGSPTAACAHCGARELETVELPATGEVYTETTVMVPPAGVEERGYRVGIVTLGEARVLARLDEEADIGTTVALSGHRQTDGDRPVPVFETADGDGVGTDDSGPESGSGSDSGS